MFENIPSICAFYLFRFVNSDKKNQVLPHMPPERRKFVHDVGFL